MRFVYPAIRLLAILAVFVPQTLLAQASGLSVTNYQFVSEERISRTESYVTYRADLINAGPARASVTASLTSLSSNVRVIAGQGSLLFGPVPANSHVTSSNTFTIYVNRIVEFSFSSLQWTFLIPVANAGPNQTAPVGATVFLNGSGSSNPSGVGTLTYTWIFTSRPLGSSSVLQNPNSVAPSFIPDKAGDYTLRLTVDNGAGTDSATTTVSTINSAPVANAGPNQTVPLFALVTLNGGGSSDVDGNPLTYSWTLISRPGGSSALLFGASTVAPTFAADKAGNYVAQLIVNDGQMNSAAATVTVTTQNTPPVANAGPSQSVNLNAVVQLNGSGSTDVDGDPLIFQWSLITRPAGSTAALSSTSSVNPTFGADKAGTFVAQLIVNDGHVTGAAATVTITTNAPIAPTANAGPNQTVAHGSAVTLNGSGTDPQGLPLTYQWALTSRPVGSLAAVASPTNPSLTFVVDMPGTYVAQLLVNNGFVSSLPSTAIITTTNTAPVANAGPNQTTTVGSVVTLNGSGSSDADHDPLTYSWSFTAKPAGSSVVLSPANGITPTFLVDLPGTYVAQLMVNDGFSNSNPSTVTISAGTTNITLTPNPLNVTTFAAGTMTVTLGSPSPAGGLQVNLAITDPSIATVPNHVQVPGNSTTATFAVTPVGVTGSASILATAAGFSNALADVIVSVPSISITLDSPTLGLTRTMNGTVTLSVPAPAFGTTINLSGNPGGIVTVPSTVNVAAGATSATFTVTGAALGSTSIVGSSPGYTSGSASVIVSVLGVINLPSNVSVGPNQSAAFPVNLVSPAPAGGVTVTLASSDTTKVTVSPATVFIAAFTTAPAIQPQVTGVNIGSANISASAPGLTGDTQAVTVSVTLGFSPQNVTIGNGATQNLTLNLSSPAPAAGLTVNLSSSNPAVATVPGTATFAGNASSTSVPVTGVSVGTAVLHASALPGVPDATANVTVANLGSIVMPASIGLSLGQTTGLAIALPSPAPPGGVTITLVSSDPSKVSIAPGSVQIPAGATLPTSAPQVTGVNLGSATITASAAGYLTASTAALVSTSVSFSPPAMTINGLATQNIALNLASPAPAGGLTVNLSSSNTAAVTVPATATFAANTSSVNVPVTSVGAGSSTLHAGLPPSVPDATASITVQGSGNLAVPASTSLGLGQILTFPVTISTPAPAGGLTVTLTSSDPSKVTIAPATVTIAAGQTAPVPQPQVTGVNLGPATVSATGLLYTPASGAVQVNATASFNPSSMTISGITTQNLTLNLSAPAPTGGVTLNLSSSNTAIATVPATLTITAGATTAPVPVTSVTLGSATIHASLLPSIADTTATITVQSAGAAGLPANTAVGLGHSATLAVTLSGPAPAGGVTVTLVTSDTSKVTVSPATVSIAAGQTSPAVQPQVNGINLGAAAITASAPGFASATGAVQVTATVSFSPQSLTVAPGDTQTITLNLSGAAPASGLTVNLSSSNTAAATVAVTATFAAGATSVNIAVTGVAVGASTLHASLLPGIPDATASITVQAGVILPANVTIALGDVVPYPPTLSTPAPAGGVFLSLASSDTSKVTISPTNVIIQEGQTAPTVTVRVTGVSLGSAVITATVFGFAPTSQTVQVGATLNFFPASLTLAGAGTQNIGLSLSAPAPAGGMVIGLSSSNSGVASVPGSVTIPANANSVSVPVTGSAAGTATITATSGLPNVANATASVTVTSPGAISLPSNPTLGLGQTIAFPISIGTAAPVGGVTVTLASSDTGTVTLSTGSVFIAQGATTPATQPQISGPNVGSATISASAPGYGSVSVTAAVTASMVFSPQNPIIAGNGNTQPLSLALSAAAPLSGLQIFLTSSNTAVATVPGTFTFYPDGSSFTTLAIPVTSVGAGTAVIRATAAASAFVPDATANLTVTGTGAIVLQSNISVPPNQSAAFPVNLSSPAPAGGLTVTLNSGDTSKVTVSPLSVVIAAGQMAPVTQPQVTGVNLGGTTVSASAPGFTSASVSVTVGAAISFSPNTITLTGGNAQNVALNLSSPAPAGGVTITLSTSDPNVATVPSTLTIPANATSVQVTVTPVGLGTATIHASGTNLADTTLSVGVQGTGAIGLPFSTTVNLGQTVPFAVTLPFPAPPGGVSVNLSSTDTSKVTVSPSSILIAAGQTAPAVQPQVTGVNFGATNIIASSPGFTTGVGPVRVTATITFTPPNMSLSPGSVQAFTLTLSVPAPAEGLTLDVSSSDTNVATVPFIVSFAPNATTVALPVSGVAFGSSIIHINSIPNISDTTATVTVQNPGTILLPASTTVGLGQSTPLAVNLTSPAPAGGVTITLASSDTSKVTVSPTTITIAAGQTAPATQPQVTGVNLGQVNIAASGPGLASASGVVRVNAVISFVPNTLSLGGSAQNVALTLSGPAPAGGLTITFVSSNTGVATVTSSATLPANATSLNVLVTPVAPGSTVLTASAGAPNIASTTADVTVSSQGGINLPSGVVVGLSQSTTVAVSLASPAPAGGVTITLTSSDTSKATVSPGTVSIAAGQSAPSTQPQVTGAGLGSATLTAAASGYASATTTVQVGATASFTPPTMSMAGNSTQNASLSLSAPAPAGGVNVNLTSSNTSVAQVPSGVTFPAGSSNVSVPVTGLAVGTAQIQAIGIGIPATTLNVTVETAGQGTIFTSDASVGQNLEKSISIAIPNPAPSGGIHVLLTSNDPSKVLLAGRPGDPGTTSIIVPILEGLSSATGIYLQGMTASGSATVTASSSGYVSATSNVTLWPSGFVLAGPNGLGVPSFASSQGVNTTVTVYSARLDAGLNFLEVQPLRGNTTVLVNVSSDNPSVGTISGSPLTFTGGIDSATAQFHAANPGTATLTAGVPSGFSQPANAFNVLTAGVNSASLILPNVSVGKNLENFTNITLNGAAPPSGLTIIVASSDPSKLLFSNTPGAPGQSSISVAVQGNHSASLDFYVYGLASSGSVTYSASAPGFGSNTGTVTLNASGIVMQGPFGFGNPIFAINNGAPTTVTLSMAMLDGGGNFLELQALAGGLGPVSVNITSSNTTVGQITVSPVSITAGTASTTTEFQAHNAGSAVLTSDVPAGFIASQYASVPVTVSAPGIGLTDGVPIGQKLQIMGTAFLGQVAPAGGLLLTLTSNNPGGLLISASPTTAGSASLTITVPAGEMMANYYLQGVGSSGTATYTASAPGYNSRTGNVPLTPSGVVIYGPFGLGFPFLQGTVAAGNKQVFVSMAQLDPGNNAYASTQQLAGGQSLTISLGNSNASIGTLPSPVTMTGGSDTVVSPFTPLTQGSTILSVITPAGYTPSTSFTSLTAQVIP